MNFFNKKSVNPIDITQKKPPVVYSNSAEDKLNNKIEEAQAEILLKYSEIGRSYYENCRDDSQDELASLCGQVDRSAKLIDLCERQILIMKDLRLCSDCKNHVSIDSLFCNKCGSNIDTQDFYIDPDNLDGFDSVEVNENELDDLADELGFALKCPQCSEAISEETIFCTNCGYKLKNE